MNTKRLFEYEDEDFKSYQINNVGVIKIKNNVFEIMTDLSESSEFFQIMDIAEKDADIDALLMLNENGCLGNKEYSDYINRIFDQENNVNLKLKVPMYKVRARQIVVSNNYIKKVIQCNKIIFSALNGEVATPFFGASLAADYRIASENMVFSLSHSKMGLHPTGALPYFLQKNVGHTKASQILYDCNNITAKQALELGIINVILPDSNFEELCIKKINEVIEKSINTLNCTKELLNYSLQDLEEYMEVEESRFIRS